LTEEYELKLKKLLEQHANTVFKLKEDFQFELQSQVKSAEEQKNKEVCKGYRDI